MRRVTSAGFVAVLVAAIWLISPFGVALAQDSGGDDTKEKKQKTEKVSDDDKDTKGKEKGKKGQRGKKDKARGEKADKARSAGDGEDHGKKDKAGKKYKPRAISGDDQSAWIDGNPPGWSRGKKTGWGGADTPPGQSGVKGAGSEQADRKYPRGSDEWDEAKRDDWNRRLERSRERVRETIRKTGGMTEEDERSADVSIEEAAREGVPIERAEDTVNKAVKRGMRGKEIETLTRAMAYGADKDTDYDKLGGFIDSKMDEGERGDDLALSVYQEIDEKRVEKQAPPRKPWWKRVFSRD